MERGGKGVGKGLERGRKEVGKGLERGRKWWKRVEEGGREILKDGRGVRRGGEWWIVRLCKRKVERFRVVFGKAAKGGKGELRGVERGWKGSER